MDKTESIRKRVLIEHLALVRERLLAHAECIGVGKHSDVIGLAREALVELFLRDHLPSAVDYATGEILDVNDNRSGQIDIILQSAFSPKLTLFGNTRLVLADSVLAAIEVKSTLTTAGWDGNSHLKSALDSIARTRRLFRDYSIVSPNNTGGVSSIDHIPCFIFAFDGPRRDTLEAKLIGYGKHFNLDPKDYWPNVVTVLKPGYYTAFNDGWLVAAPKEPICTGNENPRQSLVGMFVYLSKIIEVANTGMLATRFHKYFAD